MPQAEPIKDSEHQLWNCCKGGGVGGGQGLGVGGKKKICFTGLLSWGDLSWSCDEEEVA